MSKVKTKKINECDQCSSSKDLFHMKSGLYRCRECFKEIWKDRFYGENAMWVCTKDWLSCEGEKYCRTGFKSGNFKKVVFDTLEKFKVKAYDDDNTLCMDFLVTCNSSFAPLDDLAMPDVGATYLKVKNPKTGKWEVL